MKEALYYTKQKNDAVKCFLCPHQCEIKSGNNGLCRVRVNENGILYSKIYDRISAIALDPIEKKPLRRFKPNTNILSVGTMGCNFKCKFCQNYHIAHEDCELHTVSPQELLQISDKHDDSIGIAFTYNEPTIWYEYVYDVTKQNKKDTVLVTNGFINHEPLTNLLPYISAMNIDIKSINPGFYKSICFGALENVQNTIKTSYNYTHIELTFLAIPSLNDTAEEMEALSKWIADVDRNIPLHIIPFRPMYQMTDLPYQTYPKILELKEIASKKLRYVY
jgi:pyruvate formate lyase activating enzyme